MYITKSAIDQFALFEKCYCSDKNVQFNAVRCQCLIYGNVVCDRRRRRRHANKLVSIELQHIRMIRIVRLTTLHSSRRLFVFYLCSIESENDASCSFSQNDKCVRNSIDRGRIFTENYINAIVSRIVICVLLEFHISSEKTYWTFKLFGSQNTNVYT